MKKLFLYLFSVALFFSCKEKKEATTYDIGGSVKNAEGELIQLEDFSAVPFVILDSAHITNGKFRMNGYINEGMYRLRFPNLDNAYLVIYHKKGSEIRIYYDVRDPLKAKVTGNDESKWLNTMAVDLSRQTDSLNKANVVLDTLIGKASDSIIEIERQKIDAAGERYKASVKNYIEQQENPVLAAYAMTFYGDVSPEIEYFIERAEILLKKDPNAPFVKQIHAELTSIRDQVLADNESSLPVGTKAPDIEMRSNRGDTLKLSSLKGTYVLLDFWASWCGPCRKANPGLVRLYKKYHNHGFEIFSVSLDKNEDQWNNARLKDGLIWRYHVSDLRMWQSPVVAQYRITSIPCTYFLDREGKILAKNLDERKLDKYLDSVLIPKVVVDTATSGPQSAVGPQ